MKLRDAIELEKLKLRTMSNTGQLDLRARHPVAQLLIHKLVVPQVFFDAVWIGRGRTVDVLAIDRGGAGDIHIVEIKSGVLAAKMALPKLLTVPANFLWIAIVSKPSESVYRLPQKLLSRDNEMGRVGIIRVQQSPNDQLRASIVLEAERFSGSYYDRADKFKAKNKPDIQFR